MRLASKVVPIVDMAPRNCPQQGGFSDARSDRAAAARRGHAQAIPDQAISAEEALDAAERSVLLRRCLAQLSPAHREIIDLVYYHRKNVEEVATCRRPWSHR